MLRAPPRNDSRVSHFFLDDPYLVRALAVGIASAPTRSTADHLSHPLARTMLGTARGGNTSYEGDTCCKVERHRSPHYRPRFTLLAERLARCASGVDERCGLMVLRAA